MRILIACDKFKGSLSAMEAAEAIRRGLPREYEIEILPIADGGEGFVDAMLVGGGGQRVAVEVLDALGREVDAEYGLRNHEGETVAFIEMSAASGIWRIPREERDPLSSSTFGTGQMIRHAVEQSGAGRVFVGIGGSVTNDGGAGMARALGVRFLDEAGVELDGSPRSLERLAGIDESGRIDLPEIVVGCDVDNPLTGGRGASAVFGPQKGAGPEDVLRLDGILARLAGVASAEQTAAMPGAGAAGGLGFGLVRFAGARLVPGFDLVAEALGLEERIGAADLVITGEGSLDSQTLGGKGPAGVAAVARGAGIPVVAVAGRLEEGAAALFDQAWSLEEFGLPVDQSIARAAELLERLVAEKSRALDLLVSHRL